MRSGEAEQPEEVADQLVVRDCALHVNAEFLSVGRAGREGKLGKFTSGESVT